MGVVLALAVAAPPAAAADTLRAGVGRADIQPPTGYYFFGWVRSDSVAKGQHTRLMARSIVLERGGRKLALVSVDLGALPNGIVVDAAKHVADLGFHPEDLIVTASHTHGGPSGYFNYSAFNTVAPSMGNPTGFEVGSAADRVLYTFLVRQLAAAIRRANDDLAPARAGWGTTELLGVTDNRSLEAHLANFGIFLEPGQGKVEMAPGGYPETIDPLVNVLRVDKVRRGGRSTPIGVFPVFSNHGTVNRPTFEVYNADHHGTAERVTEKAIRRLGRVPSSQEVVAAFGNSNEGDMTAGLNRAGPANAEWVGRAESRAFMRAWRAAGHAMSATPQLDWRWSRICYCGQQTTGGLVDKRGVSGLPFFTGSEENRGPLYDVDQQSFEGRHAPADTGPQGQKIPAYTDVAGAMPNAVPITAAQIGDRLVVTIPGEMTVEMGRRVRAEAAKQAGIDPSHVVLSGLVNDFVQYFTTPEEYERQHYEGGSTLYGEYSSNLLMEQIGGLSGRLAKGEAAPEPYAFDPRNGTTDDAGPFPAGADHGTIVEQPKATRRLQHAQLRWQGAERGYDRPVDRSFVFVQRRVGRRWRTVTTDLGTQIIWTVDDAGVYTARWEPSRRAPLASYRFVVRANRYRFASKAFRLSYSRELSVEQVGRAAVAVRYPAAEYQTDFTYRPPLANASRVIAMVDGHRVVARRRRGLRLSIKAHRGNRITIAPGAARDRWGNRNGASLSFQAG